MFDVRRLMCLVGTALLVAAFQVPAADTLKVGISVSLTGPAAEVGRNTLNGAQLAMDEINKAGGVLGRQIELVVEDDKTTNPGAVLAFSKLSGNAEIPAFLGPSRSTQIHAIAPDVMKISKPIMIDGTDPTLTHMGNPWLFRCRPNDTYSAKVMADFGVDTLGKRKWAIVHSTDTFGTSGKNALVARLKEAGIDPLLVQGYTPNSQDFTAVVLAIKKSGADILGTYAFDADIPILAREIRQLGINATWIGSPSIVQTTALHLGGSAFYGTYGVVDFHEMANPAAQAFAQRYKQIYGTQADYSSAWAYDAINLLKAAITAAAGTDPDALRRAILAIRDYQGAEGTYNFDQNGDGLHGYNIVHNENGTIVFDQHIDFKS